MGSGSLQHSIARKTIAVRQASGEIYGLSSFRTGRILCYCVISNTTTNSRPNNNNDDDNIISSW